MVLSSLTGSTTTANIQTVPQIDSAVVRQVENRKAPKEVSMSTEKFIKQYFVDIPIMIRIAKCESTFRHLDKDGDVHRGQINSQDVGVMQINEKYHLETAEKENYDIYTLQGNAAYARELYEREGTKPWNSSRPCWGKYEDRTDKALAMNK